MESLLGQLLLNIDPSYAEPGTEIAEYMAKMIEERSEWIGNIVGLWCAVPLLRLKTCAGLHYGIQSFVRKSKKEHPLNRDFKI